MLESKTPFGYESRPNLAKPLQILPTRKGPRQDEIQELGGHHIWMPHLTKPLSGAPTTMNKDDDDGEAICIWPLSAEREREREREREPTTTTTTTKS